MLKNFLLIGVHNQSLETTGLDELDHLAGVTGKMRTISLIVTALCYNICYVWEQIWESVFGRYVLWLLRSSSGSCSPYWEACHIDKCFLWTMALLLTKQSSQRWMWERFSLLFVTSSAGVPCDLKKRGCSGFLPSTLERREETGVWKRKMKCMWGKAFFGG